MIEEKEPSLELNARDTAIIRRLSLLPSTFPVLTVGTIAIMPKSVAIHIPNAHRRNCGTAQGLQLLEFSFKRVDTLIVLLQHQLVKLVFRP
jgi:hypothetical protein